MIPFISKLKNYYLPMNKLAELRSSIPAKQRLDRLSIGSADSIPNRNSILLKLQNKVVGYDVPFWHLAAKEFLKDSFFSHSFLEYSKFHPGKWLQNMSFNAYTLKNLSSDFEKFGFTDLAKEVAETYENTAPKSSIDPALSLANLRALIPSNKCLDRLWIGSRNPVPDSVKTSFFVILQTEIKDLGVNFWQASALQRLGKDFVEAQFQEFGQFRPQKWIENMSFYAYTLEDLVADLLKYKFNNIADEISKFY